MELASLLQITDTPKLPVLLGLACFQSLQPASIATAADTDPSLATTERQNTKEVGVGEEASQPLHLMSAPTCQQTSERLQLQTTEAGQLADRLAAFLL